MVFLLQRFPSLFRLREVVAAEMPRLVQAFAEQCRLAAQQLWVVLWCCGQLLGVVVLTGRTSAVSVAAVLGVVVLTSRTSAVSVAAVLGVVVLRQQCISNEVFDAAVLRQILV